MPVEPVTTTDAKALLRAAERIEQAAHRVERLRQIGGADRLAERAQGVEIVGVHKDWVKSCRVGLNSRQQTMVEFSNCFNIHDKSKC